LLETQECQGPFKILYKEVFNEFKYDSYKKHTLHLISEIMRTHASSLLWCFTQLAWDFLSYFPSREAAGDISSVLLLLLLHLLPTQRHSISKGMMITLRGVIKKFVVSQGRGIAYLPSHTEVQRRFKLQITTELTSGCSFHLLLTIMTEIVTDS